MQSLVRWWNQWIYRCAQQGHNSSSETVALISREQDSPETAALRINIYYGHGGMAIESKHYDNKLDKQRTQLYIVPDTADLAHELERIITVENLRRV